MSDTVTPAIRQAAGGDPHVTLAMEVGALLEGGLGPTYGVGDNGHSYGPFQINLPYHPGVTAQQATDPKFAASYMLQAYQAAVSRVPESLWNSNPERAAEQAAFYAERPAQDYYVARGQATVDSAYQHAVNSLGGKDNSGSGGGFSLSDLLPSPGDLLPGPGNLFGGLSPGIDPGSIPVIGDALDALNPGNWLLDAIKGLVSSGIVLRATLMVTGLVILFIGLSQIDKGDQTATETVGSGTSSVRVRVVSAGKSAGKSKSKGGATGDAEEAAEVA